MHGLRSGKLCGYDAILLLIYCRGYIKYFVSLNPALTITKLLRFIFTGKGTSDIKQEAGKQARQGLYQLNSVKEYQALPLIYTYLHGRSDVKQWASKRVK